MLYSDMKLNYCMHISFNIGLIFYLYYFIYIILFAQIFY